MKPTKPRTQDAIMALLQRRNAMTCSAIQYEVGGTFQNTRDHLRRLAEVGLVRTSSDKLWRPTQEGKNWSPGPVGTPAKIITLAALRTIGSGSQREIVAASGMALGTAARCLVELNRAGLIAPLRPGKWALTPAGESEVDSFGHVTLHPTTAPIASRKTVFVELDASLSAKVIAAANEANIAKGCWMRDQFLRAVGLPTHNNRRQANDPNWNGRTPIIVTPEESMFIVRAAGELGVQCWTRCVLREVFGEKNVWREVAAQNISPYIATARGEPPSVRKNWSCTTEAPTLIPDGFILLRDAMRRLGIKQQQELLRKLRSAGVPLLEVSHEGGAHRCVDWQKAQDAVRENVPEDPQDVLENAKQAAKRLGACEATIRKRLIRIGEAPAVRKKGFPWRMKRRDIDAALKRYDDEYGKET